MKINFRQKNAVIFDFDGTIADTFRLHERAFIEALQPYALQFDYADYTGRTTNEAIRAIFESNHKEISAELLAQLVQLKRKLANSLYAAEIKFIDGALPFIELLHKRGYKMYVGSSGSRMNITAGIEALGLARYFDDVVTADDVSKGKPDPEIFQTILDRHHIPARLAVVIEDAPSGIRAADAAGIDVVCVEHAITADAGCKVTCWNTGFPELTKQLIHEWGE